MKKTGIQVNVARKVMNISVEGKMTKADAQLFLDDYTAKTQAIKADEFELVVDCSAMQLLTQEMYEDLTHVMGLYKSTGFKHVTFQIKSNNILKMQLGRIARNGGLTNASFVDIV